jgi:hypothetical protein
MANSRRKGNQNVAKAKILFAEMGYLVDDCERRGRYLKQKDLFGLYDLVAVHQEWKPCLIQVTSNKPHTHGPYLEFAKLYGHYHKIVQIVWVDRQGWLGFVYLSEGKKIIIDGRKLTQQEFIEKWVLTI